MTQRNTPEQLPVSSPELGRFEKVKQFIGRAASKVFGGAPHNPVYDYQHFGVGQGPFSLEPASNGSNDPTSEQQSVDNAYQVRQTAEAINGSESLIFDKLNRSINNLIGSYGTDKADMSDLDRRQEAAYKEDCIYYAVKLAEVQNEGEGGQLRTVLAIDQGLRGEGFEGGQPVNVFNSVREQAGLFSVPNQILLSGVMTERTKLAVKNGDYWDTVTEIVDRRDSQLADQQLADKQPADTSIGQMASASKTNSEADAASLTKEDPGLDRQVDAFMNSGYEKRGRSWLRSRFAKVGAVAVAGISVVALGFGLLGASNEDSSSVDTTPDANSYDIDSSSSNYSIENAPTTVYQFLDQDEGAVESSSATEQEQVDESQQTPVIDDQEAIANIEPQVSKQAATLEKVEIEVGSLPWNDIQDRLVGEHGARADASQEVNAEVLKIVEAIAEDNNMSVEKLSALDPGDSFLITSRVEALTEQARQSLEGKL
jgi:hypothetical protein